MALQTAVYGALMIECVAFVLAHCWDLVPTARTKLRATTAGELSASDQPSNQCWFEL